MEIADLPKIDITGIDLPTLIVRLHAASRPVGMGVIHWQPITRSHAVELIAAYRPLPPHVYGLGEPLIYSCDYVYGVPIKGQFTSTTWHRPDLYDVDAGVGTAQRVIDSIRRGE